MEILKSILQLERWASDLRIIIQKKAKPDRTIFMMLFVRCSKEGRIQLRHLTAQRLKTTIKCICFQGILTFLR